MALVTLEAMPCGCVSGVYCARPTIVELELVEAKGPHCLYYGHQAGKVVRLGVDPLEGPAARVFASAAPFGETAIFRRSECRVFHFSLDTTGWRIDHIQDYRLSLELDCANQAGDSLAGKASASHCH